MIPQSRRGDADRHNHQHYGGQVTVVTAATDVPKGAERAAEAVFRTLARRQGDKRSTAQPPPTSPAPLSTRR